MPKQNFEEIVLALLLKFLGKLVEQAPVCVTFYFIFFSFLTSQTPSKDDFSDDEWLKPLPP